MTENAEFKDPLSIDYKGQDEMDIILGVSDDDFFESLSIGTETTETTSEEPIVSTDSSPVLEKSVDMSKLDLPTLRGENFPTDYIELVERIKTQYSYLTAINYDDIYQELADLSIKCQVTPSLEHINDELQRVQAAKDRLSEILINVIKSHNFKKRAVDILHDAWGKFTSEKNAEGRKGDAIFRLSNFHLDFSETEALLKTCMHVLKNLDSLSDNLSRRITIYQLITKHMDVGRGALPDNEWGRKINIDGTFDKDDSQINEDGEIIPQDL